MGPKSKLPIRRAGAAFTAFERTKTIPEAPDRYHRRVMWRGPRGHAIFHMSRASLRGDST